MKKHILVIGGMRAVHQELKELDAKLTIICDAQRVVSRIGKKDQGLYDRLIGIDKDAALEEYIEIARAIHKIDSFDGVGCYNEELQIIASRVAQSLGLDYLDHKVIFNINNKFYMRKELDRLKYNTVKYSYADDYNDIVDFVDNNGYPFIIKPIMDTGSRGVSLIKRKEDIRPAMDRLDSQSENKGYYLEDFVAGREFSVETVTYDNKTVVVGITEKFKSEHNFVELGHCVPARISQEENELLEKFVKEVLGVLGVNNTVGHSEVILSNDGPVLIETHARIAGDNIGKLVLLAYDINLFKVMAMITLGMNPLEDYHKNPNEIAAAVWYLGLENPAVIQSIRDTETIKSPDVYQIDMFKSAGDAVNKMESSFDRVACVIAKGKDPDQALDSCRAVINQLEEMIEVKIAEDM